MAFEVQDFQEEVIETSHQIPVVVDFWAPWCGPCRVLGPVLEKLAGEQTERWKLVKINSDLHPDLSMEYGIRGIPAVKLFAGGQVIDEFTGALPEVAVRQWLDKALPSENKKRLQQVEMLLATDEVEAATALLEEVVREEPLNPQAAAMLAPLLVFDEPDRAATLARTAASAEPRFLQVADAVVTFAHLITLGQDPSSLPDEPGRDAYLAALKATGDNDFDTAIQHFIAVIQQNRYYNDDGARKACIAIFNLLGPDHPITRKHRRMFDMVLY